MPTLHTADPENILVASDRVRQEFNKAKMVELVESFKRIGQLQPGVCIKFGEEGKFLLVAGERRLRACKMAKLPFSFLLKEEASEELLLEIELDENLCRSDLTWQEEVRGRERRHEIRTKLASKDGYKLGLRESAKAEDSSLAQMHEDLEIAGWLELPEVAQAKSKTDAKKVIKKYKTILGREESLRQVKTEIKDKEASSPQDDGTIVIEGTKIPRAALMEFDSRIILGNWEEVSTRIPDGSQNLVIWDPPWGVSLEGDANKEEFVDDPEIIQNCFPKWLDLVRQKMAENSHLYLFFGIVHYEFIYSQLKRVGLQTNGLPIYWIKQGSHVTRNPEIWPGRAVEPIAFARLGNKKLIRLGAPDYIITPAPSYKLKDIHPSAKHPDVFLELIKRSAYPGDKLLDPMCGSGMCGLAAEVLRQSYHLDWTMIECHEPFRQLALTNVVKGYYQVITVPREREPVVPLTTPYTDEHPLPEDFKELDPGSEMWKRFWRAHPEKQNEMLAFRKERGK